MIASGMQHSRVSFSQIQLFYIHFLHAQTFTSIPQILFFHIQFSHAQLCPTTLTPLVRLSFTHSSSTYNSSAHRRSHLFRKPFLSHAHGSAQLFGTQLSHTAQNCFHVQFFHAQLIHTQLSKTIDPPPSPFFVFPAFIRSSNLGFASFAGSSSPIMRRFACTSQVKVAKHLYSFVARWKDQGPSV